MEWKQMDLATSTKMEQLTNGNNKKIGYQIFHYIRAYERIRFSQFLFIIRLFKAIIIILVPILIRLNH